MFTYQNATTYSTISKTTTPTAIRLHVIMTAFPRFALENLHARLIGQFDMSCANFSLRQPQERGEPGPLARSL